jgi:transposase-like protein
VWTYTAIDADTKLMISWYVGQKDAESAYGFMVHLASRLDGRVQLTTDSFLAYTKAVKAAFGENIDYAVLSKLYG